MSMDVVYNLADGAHDNTQGNHMVHYRRKLQGNKK